MFYASRNAHDGLFYKIKYTVLQYKSISLVRTNYQTIAGQSMGCHRHVTRHTPLTREGTNNPPILQILSPERTNMSRLTDESFSVPIFSLHCCRHLKNTISTIIIDEFLSPS